MKKIIVIFFIFCEIFCFSQTDTIHVAKEKKTEVYTSVEEQAEFPGGILELRKFIGNNIIFPTRARSDTTFRTCKVFIKFIVNEDGVTSNPEVLRGCLGFPECDEESMRVIKNMPKWKPAKIGGQPVKCYFNIPINFKLN